MKIFRLVVATFFLAALMISSTASAVDTKYFNGDKNYVFYGASMGMGYFIDRSTLTVEKYAPPIYIISVDVVGVSNYFNGGTEISKKWRQTERFKYDYSTRKMYIYAPNWIQACKSRYERYCKDMKIQPDTTIDWSGDWAYINPDVYYGEGAMPAIIGEMTFALAYKIKFHGDRYSIFKKGGYTILSGDFYDAVRGVVGEVKDSI